MTARLSTFFLSAFLVLLGARAADWYASPAVTTGGSGTLASPWPLATAINSTAIKAGDTLWLRGGTFQGLYTGNINGSSNGQITIRNYNKERAIIDGQFLLNGSAYITVWGLEFIDSAKATRPDPWDTVRSYGIGTKFINCLFHDCCIALAPPGPYEAYGNVMWNCGRTGREHALYWQNDGPTPKTAQENLISFSAGFGVHFYGSAGNLKSLNVIGNSVCGSGATLEPKAEILVGGGMPIENCVIRDNDVYSDLGRGIQLGWGANDISATVEQNFALGEMALWLNTPFSQLTMRSNTYITSYHSTIFTTMSTVTADPTLWNKNRFLSRYSNWANQFAYVGAGWITFDAWKSLTGLDSTSTYGNSLPPDRIVVRPNKYEAKRGHVTVWNWSAAQYVDVDLSTVLSVGDTYEVRSAQNYFGGVLVTGTYGGGTVRIPMINLTYAPNLYWTPTRVPNNFSRTFSSFVVIGSSSTGANTAPTISTVNNVTLVPGVSTGPLGFTVSDGQTAATSLTVTSASSNTTLVPNANVVLGGSGNSRTVSVTPAGNLTGTANITLTVSDGTMSSSTTFTVTVATVNTTPSISTSVSSVSIAANGTISGITVTVGDAETTPGSLALTASSSNPTLLPVANITLGGSGSSRTMSLTPAANQSGNATVILTVSDGSLSASASVSVTVNAGNTGPTISGISATSTTVNTASAPIAFTISDAETAAGNLTVTAASSNTGLVPLSGIVFGGTGANRTATITPASNQAGTCTITFTVSDGSLSASSAFLFTINPANSSRFALNLEAELATVSGPVGIVSSPAASHGGYCLSQTPDSGTVSFSFSVPASGNYVIWSRIISANASSDSYYVGLDGQAEDIFDTAENKWSSNWQWSVVTGRSTGAVLGVSPRIFSLSAGAHTVTFRVREPNAQLDQILITDDQAYVPPNLAIPVGIGTVPAVLGTAP